MQKAKKHLQMSHVQIIALGFFLIIMAGTILLILPVSTYFNMDCKVAQLIGCAIFVHKSTNISRNLIKLIEID